MSKQIVLQVHDAASGAVLVTHDVLRGLLGIDTGIPGLVCSLAHSPLNGLIDWAWSPAGCPQMLVATGIDLKFWNMQVQQFELAPYSACIVTGLAETGDGTKGRHSHIQPIHVQTLDNDFTCAWSPTGESVLFASFNTGHGPDRCQAMLFSASDGVLRHYSSCSPGWETYERVVDWSACGAFCIIRHTLDWLSLTDCTAGPDSTAEPLPMRLPCGKAMFTWLAPQGSLLTHLNVDSTAALSVVHQALNSAVELHLALAPAQHALSSNSPGCLTQDRPPSTCSLSGQAPVSSMLAATSCSGNGFFMGIPQTCPLRTTQNILNRGLSFASQVPLISIPGPRELLMAGG